jgi:iron(III) transport system substrate-binding protein
VKKVLLVALLLLAGCPQGQQGTTAASVTIYCAADRAFAQPILERFERESGIRVDAKWDTEATKTVGLAQAIEAERARPRADVFWCNEPLNLTLLAEKGALAPVGSGAWTPFAARVRVLLVNTAAFESNRLPRRLEDLTDPAWKGRAGIANPLFGTTSTHFAALFATWGEDKARAFVRALAANDVAICAGNADVMRRVASGELAFGLTDTDDAHEAVSAGKPVTVVFPDQDGAGALLLPNGVGIVAGGPNPESARKLAAFLASAPVEEELAKGPGQHLPLLGGLRPSWIPASLRTFAPDWKAVAASTDKARAAVQAELLGKK